MKKIAIIGSGISGMACAYYLSKDFDIRLFEQDEHPGGHTNTQFISEDGKKIPVDTGFMTYNKKNYPYLTRLFDSLGIKSYRTNVSFSVQHMETGLEFCNKGIPGYFAQKNTLFSFKHWAMIKEILRFNMSAKALIARGDRDTLEEFLEKKKFNKTFKECYITPLAAALWYIPGHGKLDFPAGTIFKHLKSQGLLSITKKITWLTMKGGTRVYKYKLLDPIKHNLLVKSRVLGVSRLENGKVTVRVDLGGTDEFDAVIIATHADQAMDMLQSPTNLERELLGSFKYNRNHVCLHFDESVMPTNKSCWSSWNYRLDKENKGSVHFWMNRFQYVSNKRNYFVSLNSREQIKETRTIWQSYSEHPIFDQDAVSAQKRLHTLNESGPIYYCGSYFGNGTHEDALVSALRSCKALRDRYTMGGISPL